MTTFRKEALTLDPTHEVEGVSAGKVFATKLLHASTPFIWYATWPYLEKVKLSLRHTT